MTEQVLIQNLLNKNPKALEIFYHQYLPSVNHLIYRFSRSTEEAEDLFHELYFYLLEALQKFRGNCSIKTFIFRVARNFLLNHGRKRQKESNLYLIMDKPVSDFSEDLIVKEEREKISLAFSKLHEEDRILLIMKIILDFPYKEISEIVEQPVSSLKVRIFRAKQKLYQNFETSLIERSE